MFAAVSPESVYKYKPASEQTRESVSLKQPMNMVKVEQVEVVGTRTILEGPHWSTATQSLYFNDILEGRIFRYDYRENKVYTATIEGEEGVHIGFIVPVFKTPNQFVVGAGPRLILVAWDGRTTTASKVRVVVEVDQEIGQTRFNDGKVDPRGRIFAGGIRDEKFGDVFEVRIGSFYRIDGGKATKLREKVLISNGLTWNENTNKFYYIDTGDLNLKEYDYKPSTGEISNEKVILEVPKDTYFLDGMTIDKEGLLYIATFNGGRVIVVDPVQRKIVREIEIPGVPQITSVAFGGPNLDELFVTTAALGGLTAPNGGLFKITGLGVTGTQMYDAKV